MLEVTINFPNYNSNKNFNIKIKQRGLTDTREA
jgi:hypothetical protein